MKVEIQLPVNEQDAGIKAFDAKGQEIPVPARLEIEPYFYPKQSMASVLFYKAKSAVGKTIQTAVIGVLLKSGRVTLSDRSVRVVPDCDTPPKPEDAAASVQSVTLSSKPSVK